MSRGLTTKTPERVAAAQQMRSDGMSWRAICEALAVARPTAEAWVKDPDGTKLRARKDSYASKCIDCGGPTSGSEGRREEPRCLACANVKSGFAAKIWTREAVVLAIHEWAAEYGEPPAGADWNGWEARHRLNDADRADRYERDLSAGRCASHTAVIKAFGTWNAAIKAAGYEPRTSGGGGGNEARKRSVRARTAA